jgi:hypothetical protein
MKVEMTGKEDREGPWKIAVCGHGGAGKTLFASTAPKPLYVFFSLNPRIKSIARRYMPHVKIVNQYDGDNLTASVQDQLAALAFWLQIEEHEYETLVIDTGDELFQAMKEARRAKNGGEFQVGDWSWIADAYRAVIEGLIDLQMNVIVNYHIKTAQEGDSGQMFKELALQGAAKDEAPGWFDVIGALDTYEVVDEDGDTVTKRVFLTSSSRMYPWVKDHSGALPRHFLLSDNFVGDFNRMLELLTSEEEDEKFSSHEVLAELTMPEGGGTKSGVGVPSPEQLKTKKRAPKAAPKKASKPEVEKTEPEEVAAEVQDSPEQAQQSQQEPVKEEKVAEPEPIPSPEEEEQEEPEVEATHDTDASIEEAAVVEAAEQLIKEELGAEEVFLCEVCSEEITDTNVRELGQIRFHKNLCRLHYLEKLKAK